MDFFSGFQKIFGAKRWLELYDAREEVIAGFVMTVKVSFFSLIFALIIGVAVGLLMATQRIVSRTYEALPLYLEVGVIYLIFSTALTWLQGWGERALARRGMERG